MFKKIFIYFQITLFNQIPEGFYKSEIKTLPIVGKHYFEGIEIINNQNKKVVYRKVKDWGKVQGIVNFEKFIIVKKFFWRNV